MNRLSVLLLEDKPLYIEKLEAFISKVLTKGSYTLESCRTVEAAFDKINEKKIDILFADLAIPGDKSKDAGKKVIFEGHRVNLYNFTFLYSNQMNDIGNDVRDEMEASGLKKNINFDLTYKTWDPDIKEHVELFKTRFYIAVDRWSKLKCLEIAAEGKGGELEALMKSRPISRDSIITTASGPWSLLHLFPSYKARGLTKGADVFRLVADYFIEFPIILPEISKRKKKAGYDPDMTDPGEDRWLNGNDDFALGLREYYIEFYLNYRDRLALIEEEAAYFLNNYYKGYIMSDQDCKDNCTKFFTTMQNRGRRKGFAYSGHIPNFYKAEFYGEAMDKFRDRLLCRLIILGGFLYLTESITQILDAMILNRGNSTKNGKLVMRFFFIKGFNDVDIDAKDFSIAKLRNEVAKRKQATVLQQSSGDEKRFLKNWWETLNNKEQLSEKEPFRTNLQYLFLDLPSKNLTGII